MRIVSQAMLVALQPSPTWHIGYTNDRRWPSQLISAAERLIQVRNGAPFRLIMATTLAVPREVGTPRPSASWVRPKPSSHHLRSTRPVWFNAEPFAKLYTHTARPSIRTYGYEARPQHRGVWLRPHRRGVQEMGAGPRNVRRHAAARPEPDADWGT